LEAIRPNPFQPRKTFEQGALEELADSIRRHGVLQPIVVRPTAGEGARSEGDARYEIVAGERRWRASRLAGLRAIPAVVRPEIRDEQLLELALVENLQRKDLDAIERATGYQQMIRALGITQEQVAEKVGLQRATVANHLRLLELPGAAQEAVRRELISMGHARALLGMPDAPSLLALVERIAREDLSVRDVERIVREAARGKKAAAVLTPMAPVAPWLRELEERMRLHLGTKVQVRNNPGYRGQIVVEYFNRADLDRLCEVLAPRERLQ
jgi:ParB family chromosome partitioning protein